jgi:hypothetical protein
MQPDILFDDRPTDGSPLFEDVQALDRLAKPERSDTEPSRVVPDECPLIDDLRAADRILRMSDATPEMDKPKDTPNPQESRAQQVACWYLGTTSGDDLKRNRKPEYVSVEPNPFRQPPHPLARAPPCACSR